MDTNIIYCGDCLVKLKDIPNDSIDLIYIDPPFSSNRNYVAFWQEQEKRHFEDRFENVRAYIDYMRPRLIELYRVLKPTGSFYYHCDWHASHYIKVLLDRDDLFGYGNFRNEIIWKRSTTHSDARGYARVSDTLLFYSKTDHYTWNRIPVKHSESYLKSHYGHVDKDGRRFRYDNLTKPKGSIGYFYELLGCSPPPNGWRMPESHALEWIAEGKIEIPPKGEIPSYKRHLDDMEGTTVSNIWIDISPINSQAKERQGYPTQKPLALLDRIIQASSNKDNIILDAFCGCGTTLIAAQRQKERRRWIGIDISPTACRVMSKRLEDETGIKEGKDFYIKDLPKTVGELRVYPAFEFQNWAINALGGIPNKVKVRDRGIDGKLYPIEDIKKEKKSDQDMFGIIDRYIPIQVKRTDQVGCPDIENFEVAMKRDKRIEGIFIGFNFSRDALREIRRAEREEGLLIEPKTVSQIVEDQLDKSLL